MGTRKKRRWKRCGCLLDVRQMFDTKPPCWPFGTAHDNYAEIQAHAPLSGIDWICRYCQQFTSETVAQTALLSSGAKHSGSTAFAWQHDWHYYARCFLNHLPSILSVVLNTSNYTELPAKHLTNPLLSFQGRFWLIRIKNQKRLLYNARENYKLKGLLIDVELWKKKQAQTCCCINKFS